MAQVKDALAAARRHRSVGTLLDPVFRFAIAAGKHVRSQTPITQGTVSMVGAALELVRERLGTLDGRQSLVLGAGRMGELATKQLVAKGSKWTYVASRTLETATRVADQAGAEALPFHNLQTALATVDVVICCTDAPHFVLNAADFAPVDAVRKGRPLLLVDLAVPRNLDPDLAQYAGVTVVDIDDLEAVAKRHRLARQGVLGAAEAIIDVELGHYETWRQGVPLNPAIASLRSKFTSVREQELERFLNRHAAHFTPEQQALVDGLTRSIVNKFLHEPLMQLKDSASGQRNQMIRALELLYGLNIEGFGDYYRRRVDERRQAQPPLVSASI
jgi:glutamyl-tRNA reductase